MFQSSEGCLVNGLNVVIIQFKTVQVWKARKGDFIQLFDQVSAQIDGIQRMDRLYCIRNFEDSVTEQVEIFDV